MRYIFSGKRPERLSHFDEACWNLMQCCWNGDSHKRPLLGVVESNLTDIIAVCETEARHQRGAKTLSPRNLNYSRS